MQTPEIGTVIYTFASLGSTNAFASKLLSHMRPRHGTTVSALHQTAGRGQAGRGWYGAPGLNISLSCILYPDIVPGELFALNAAVALAVRDTAVRFCDPEQVRLKWPNDVYVTDCKLAGILIQNIIQGSSLSACIAGIGLNVNETLFPSELPNPTSLLLEWKRKGGKMSSFMFSGPKRGPLFEVSEVRTLLLQSLTARFSQLAHTRAQLILAYDEVLYRKDLDSAFTIPGNADTRTGRIQYVDSTGRLVVLWENGTEGRYLHGEIEYIL